MACSGARDSVTELEPDEIDVGHHFTFVEVSQDKKTATYVGKGTHSDVGAVQTRSPCPRKRVLYYFEVEILDLGLRGEITVGLTLWKTSQKVQDLDLYYFEVEILDLGLRGEITVGLTLWQSRKDFFDSEIERTGTEPNSFAYRGDEGRKYVSPQQSQSTRGEPYGPAFQRGDVIGCGADFVTGNVWFTRNGSNLGVAANLLQHAVVDPRAENPAGGTTPGEVPFEYFPTVGLHSPGERVRFRFQPPFAYNIHAHRVDLVQAERKAINNQTTSSARRSAMRNLIRDYLVRGGFAKTFTAFETGGETSVVVEEDDHDPDPVPVDPLEASMQWRSEVKQRILHGDVQGAISQLKKELPDFFEWKNYEESGHQHHPPADYNYEDTPPDYNYNYHDPPASGGGLQDSKAATASAAGTSTSSATGGPSISISKGFAGARILGGQGAGKSRVHQHPDHATSSSRGGQHQQLPYHRYHQPPAAKGKMAAQQGASMMSSSQTHQSSLAGVAQSLVLTSDGSASTSTTQQALDPMGAPPLLRPAVELFDGVLDNNEEQLGASNSSTAGRRANRRSKPKQKRPAMIDSRGAPELPGGAGANSRQQSPKLRYLPLALLYTQGFLELHGRGNIADAVRYLRTEVSNLRFRILEDLESGSREVVDLHDKVTDPEKMVKSTNQCFEDACAVLAYRASLGGCSNAKDSSMPPRIQAMFHASRLCSCSTRVETICCCCER
eukprot:g13353.t1